MKEFGMIAASLLLSFFLRNKGLNKIKGLHAGDLVEIWRFKMFLYFFEINFFRIHILSRLFRISFEDLVS